MSRKYKFRDSEKLYFITFAVINWIDLFIRNNYKEVIIQSIRYCQQNKGFQLYGWCIMTSHIHLIAGANNNSMSNIVRDLKRHSSEEIHKAIINNKTESRREWVIWMMERAARKYDSRTTFRLWQPECHPVELGTAAIAHQKLQYLHNNPVEAGFVRSPADWLYSSAIDYDGGKGLIDIIQLEPLQVFI